MKVRRPNALYIGLFSLALLLSSIITLALYFKLTPWQMELIQTEGAGYKVPYEFRDLNHDGYSECVHLANDPDRTVHYLSFYNHQGAIIDQCNTAEPIFPDQIFYGDYSGDGFDECFVFTTKQDSVFLYVFNIIKQETVLNREFVINIPQEHPFYRITAAGLYDINNDSWKELLFTLHPGPAPKPRGLYVFDLSTKKISNRFENHSSKDNFLLYDLSGDGRDEIIVMGKANGNGSDNVPFSDFKNWVFILDHHLKDRFPPLPYGSYPSVVRAIPVQIQDKPYLLIAHFRAGPKFVQKPLGIYLVDSNGRFKRRQYFAIQNMAGLYITPDNAENPHQLFITFDNDKLARYDIAANTLTLKENAFSNARKIRGQDMDLDGKAELLIESENGVGIFDQDLTLFAKKELPGPVHLSFRLRGPNLPPEIGVRTTDHFYQYQATGNPLFKWLPLWFIVFFISIGALLMVSNVAFTRALTFFNYFIYSIKETSTGIVLLKPNGRVYYFNAASQHYLDRGNPLKNKPYHKVFTTYHEISDKIAECIQSGKAVQSEFILNKEKMRVKGEIRVIPFKTSFNYIYAYLLEIKDFTEPVLTDRHRVWSRTVQKMAHDIKTPIAAVQLNLETLQMKITELHALAAKETEADFILIQKELSRVNELTRQFLKFSNLEKPNFKALSLTEIIQRVKSHFLTYFNNRLTLELQIEEVADDFSADEKQLEILFQIFIENAIDAMKGTGKIIISAHSESDLIHPEAEHIVIEVADNGPGIAQEHQNKIYEPYFTTKNEGNGMGLTIAHKIVSDHQGKMELISKKGFGAVFRMILPKKPTENLLA